MKRLIIYDIPEKEISETENDIVISANPMVKSCLGCFSGWLKTPGKCVINDRCPNMAEKFGECDEVIIISPIVYGGYSAPIKAILDRSISYVMPFFRIVNGEMHHKLRYKKSIKMTVHFYGDCDDEEQETAQLLVKANAINFGASDAIVKFHKNVNTIQEVMI